MELHYCSDKKYFDRLIFILQFYYPWTKDTKVEVSRPGLDIKYIKYHVLKYKLKYFSLHKEYTFIVKDKLRIGIVYTPKPKKSMSYLQLINRIAIDREDCFDKWQKCPIVLPIPETGEQLEYLIKSIDWLLTDEGYCVSNEYECEKWIKEYPLGV